MITRDDATPNSSPAPLSAADLYFQTRYPGYRLTSFGCGVAGSQFGFHLEPEDSGVVCPRCGRYHKRFKDSHIVTAGQVGYGTNILEGANNTAKVIKRVGYGFQDFEYFSLKLKSAFPGKRFKGHQSRLEALLERLSRNPEGSQQNMKRQKGAFFRRQQKTPVTTRIRTFLRFPSLPASQKAGGG